MLRVMPASSLTFEDGHFEGSIQLQRVPLPVKPRQKLTAVLDLPNLRLVGTAVLREDDDGRLWLDMSGRV